MNKKQQKTKEKVKHALNVKSKQPTNRKEIILLYLRGATESSGGGLLKQIANDCWLKLRQSN